MSEYENECMLEGMCDVHVCISKCVYEEVRSVNSVLSVKVKSVGI